MKFQPPVPLLLIIMGVSGSGKTSIASCLAQQYFGHSNDDDNDNNDDNNDNNDNGDNEKVNQSKLNDMYIEADQYHPPQNIYKMSVLKQPLTDEDREPWLIRLFDISRKKLKEKYNNYLQKGASDSSASGPVMVIMTCSALKESYRMLLGGKIKSLLNPNEKNVNSHCNQINVDQGTVNEHDTPDNHHLRTKTVFVYLKGEFKHISKRMEARNNHYMKADMLKSQFDTLEEPKLIHNTVNWNSLDVDYLEIDTSSLSSILHCCEKINELLINSIKNV